MEDMFDDKQNWLTSMLEKSAEERALPTSERRKNWLTESRQTAPRNQKKYWLQRKAELANEGKSILDTAQAAGRDLTDGEQKWFTQVESDLTFCNGYLDAHDAEEMQSHERSGMNSPIALPEEIRARLAIVQQTPGRTGRTYNELFAKFSQAEGQSGWKSGEEFLQVVHSGLFDSRLRASTMTEGENSAGGYTVPQILAAQWLDASLEDEIVRPRCRVEPMISDNLNIAGFDVNDLSTGAPFGFSATWAGENDEATPQTGKFRKIQLLAKKLRLYAEASSELAEDGRGFEGQIGEAMVRAIGWGLDFACLQGDGAGQPLGVLKSPSLIVIPKEIGQPYASILYENVLQLFSRLHPSSMKRAIWVANSTTIPQLLSLSQPIGTAGVPVPAVKQDNGRFSLLGMELIFTEKVPVLGQQGDLSLIDFSQYSLGLRRDVALDRSTAPGWTRDVVSYRVILRADGQARWDKAQTPKNGDSRSWAVTLATRV